MSAGYLQLAALGQQDAYLTGSPQVTYFSGVYKRHTPFVLEAYDIPFQSQQVLYGTENICKIPLKGDLVRALTLKVDLPALYDPGIFWGWPTNSQDYVPHIFTNSTYNYLPTNIQYYTTDIISNWLLPPLSNYINYSVSMNKFIFSNCATLEVDSGGGIFWGLDPLKGRTSPINSSNLIYSVDTVSNLSSNSSSNTLANTNFFITLSADFTLQQSGWTQNTGLKQSNDRTSLFLSTTNYTISSNVQFINFANWKNQDSISIYSVTSNGRIKFANNGFYMVRAVICTDNGSVSNISYGSDTQEYISPIPVVPRFEYSADIRISTNPSMTVLMPLKVKNTSNTYYFYINTTSSVNKLTTGTFLCISPVDDLYVINKTINITKGISNVFFYNNIQTPTNRTTTLGSDSSITFKTPGTWLVSGIIYINNNYVSNVSVNGYTQELTINQGRDPTIAFSLPVVVTDTTKKYFPLLGTTSNTFILSSSFYVLEQLGASSYKGLETIIPYNGLLCNTASGSNQTVTTSLPLNMRTKFSNTGQYSNIIQISTSGNLQFTNVGTYMLTTVLSCSDNVKSITFGTTTYNFTITGNRPTTTTIPYQVTQNNTDVPIYITTDQIGTTTTLYSNTFIAVYPVASNVNPSINYSYYDSVGTWLIDRADLLIGGQTVQTLTGEFIEIYNDLYVPSENQPGLTLLTGKYDTTQITPPGRTYFVNLPFYFYNNPGLALPLVALERQDVEVHVTFKKLQALTAINTTSITAPLTATIITEYVYLADDEANWFKNSQIDYIIQQCQYQTFQLPALYTSSVMKLNFLNPIRELFFVLQLDGTDPYVYSDLERLGMNFNSSEMFTEDVTDALYLNSIEPFNHYTNYPSRMFYMYSFATQTNTPKPYGQVNFSRIRDVFIKLRTAAYNSPKQFRVLGINYNVLTIKGGIAGVMFNSVDL